MPASRADVLFIFAHSVSLVKNFFQVFSGLFSPEPLVSVLFQARSHLPARTHLVYHAHSRLSSTFSDPFPQGRPGSPRFLPILVRFSCPLARRSDRIPLRTPFVNTFFHFLSCFFRNVRRRWKTPLQAGVKYDSLISVLHYIKQIGGAAHAHQNP